MQDAEIAITGMNGQWLGGRAIRTNWANGKSNANGMRDSRQNGTSAYTCIGWSIVKSS
jgi:RNA recognition motif-containing protein